MQSLLDKGYKFGVLKGSPIARTLAISELDEHKKVRLQVFVFRFISFVYRGKSRF